MEIVVARDGSDVSIVMGMFIYQRMEEDMIWTEIGVTIASTVNMVMDI